MIKKKKLKQRNECGVVWSWWAENSLSEQCRRSQWTKLILQSFDCHDFLQKHRHIHIFNRASAEDDFQRLNTNDDEVRHAFQHVNPNKAIGPDNIAQRVLKAAFFKKNCIICVFFHKYCSNYLENCMHCVLHTAVE